MSKTSHLSPPFFFFFLLICNIFLSSCFGHGFTAEQVMQLQGCHLWVLMQNLILKGRGVGQGMLICTASCQGLFHSWGRTPSLAVPSLKALSGWQDWTCRSLDSADFPGILKALMALQLQHSRPAQGNKLDKHKGCRKPSRQDAFKLFLDYFRSDQPGWLRTH